ncbi:DUF4271 domain-containing protein [Sphingobacterium alkalisoli]|uniref:DUF4271 domain-containing protein n=1 Tax=Sphingobacterium alkalisoli TaxID=1874115 RepID=A0A4U0H868_9SPHI|nr:DUF4271 domain-containing protein [Sphingobacterium alkalisoli]TJY68075.1 DUF4271 domain-containing protein [Sphingobacterium alkalisoli]
MREIKIILPLNPMNTLGRKRQRIKKRHYLLTIILWIVGLSAMSSQARVYFGNSEHQDSLFQNEDTVVRLDSGITRGVDSSYLDLVFVNPDRSHYFLEKYRDNLIVKGNEFMKWIAFSNQLVREKQLDIIPSSRKSQRPPWIIGVLIVLFLSTGLIRFFFPMDFQRIIESYYNERELQQISKEDNMLTSWPYIFLYLIFSLSLGLFLLINQSRFDDIYALSPLNFLKVSGIVALLFALKIFIIRIIAFIFEIERMVREYITILYLVYFNSMLFLMPVLLFVTFLPQVYFNFLLILFSIIVSILFLYRFLRTAWGLLGNHKFSIFYLILYLCSLEITPILILVKALSN